MAELRESQPNQEIVVHLGRNTLSKFLDLCEKASSIEDRLPSTQNVEAEKAIKFYQEELGLIRKSFPTVLCDAERYVNLKSNGTQDDQETIEQIYRRRIELRDTTPRRLLSNIFAAAVNCLVDLASLQKTPRSVLELKTHLPKLLIEETQIDDENRLAFGGLAEDEVVLKISILSYDLERKPWRSVIYQPAKKTVKEDL